MRILNATLTLPSNRRAYTGDHHEGGVSNVRFWHTADIATVLNDVCFWGKADITFRGGGLGRGNGVHAAAVLH